MGAPLAYSLWRTYGAMAAQTCPSFTIKQEIDMTGESAAMMRTWRVGKRRVTMTAPQVRIGQVGMATIEWHPDMPRRLSRRERKQYRTGGDAAFAELCGELGIRGALGDI
jgi:hypothetical protein